MMRKLIAVSAIALGAMAGASVANAGYFFFFSDTSERRHYDQHFDQYPLWAQKAFTPGNRR